MPSLDERIAALDTLGRFMAQRPGKQEDNSLEVLNKHFLSPFHKALAEAELFNPWFTQDNLNQALDSWAAVLSETQLREWLEGYPQASWNPESPKTVAVIMAGNIPLVGLHDLISVLLSGHKVLGKPSSDDAKILPVLLQVLVAAEPNLAPYMRLADGQIRDFDAVIATGSNNSARYFHRYFGSYPHIIRKNRSSVAVLTGEESEAELQALGEDVFRYFGLGCRSVSKVYLPRGFDKDRLFKAFYPFRELGHHHKYSNNYDYNRAIYLMEKIDFLENGFFILREHPSLHAPVGVLHTEAYEQLPEVEEELQKRREEWQCVVSQAALQLDTIPLGKSQEPALGDYADGVDTLAFLQELS